MAVGRARLGRMQREKSRAALIEAAARVFQTQQPEATVVEDLIVAAGVGRGTFYNHFKDIAEVWTAVALKLAEEFNDTIRLAYKHIADPAERICVAMQLIFQRTAADASWGWLIVKLEQDASLRDMLRKGSQPDVREGFEAGRFAQMHQETATVLVFGATFSGMRSILEGRIASAHAHEIVAATMRGLGMPPEEAIRLATATSVTASGGNGNRSAPGGSRVKRPRVAAPRRARA
jgi:AcrR family transcriptional regulator